MSRKTRNLELAVIDATTGTVLSPDNLYVVSATSKTLDKACNSDSDAFKIAMAYGVRIDAETLRRILDKGKLAKERHMSRKTKISVINTTSKTLDKELD